MFIQIHALIKTSNSLSYCGWYKNRNSKIIHFSRRDKEVNRQRYERIVLDSTVDGYRPFITEQVSASALRVGDIVMLHKGQRVPADMILLRTNETMGTVFIRTDQLDGEIDWKLRLVTDKFSLS